MAQPSLPSFDDLYRRIEALPQAITGEILEPGVLRTMSRPGRAHRWAAQNCYAALISVDRKVGGAGWWIEQEAEIRLGDRLTVPDLAGWRIERVPELPADDPLTVVPEWCCEVLSPSTEREDRLLKLPLYTGAGVPWIWLVAPEIRSVEIYQPSEAGLPTLVGSASDADARALPPFDHPIHLTSWWQPSAEPPRS